LQLLLLPQLAFAHEALPLLLPELPELPPELPPPSEPGLPEASFTARPSVEGPPSPDLFW
jgi:hypothetical protein